MHPKIAIVKAFDTVNWKFVVNIMTALDVPLVFINWIEECISTPKYRVKINGITKGFFAAKRGSRQGDQLSPYIFVLCMEVLSQLLNRAAMEDRILYHPLCAKLKLTHLSFAYDLMIFTAVCSCVAISAGVKDILDDFYIMLGLKMSYNESKIFCCNAPFIDQQSLANIMGLKLGKLHVRYLGVPLISSKLKDSNCRPLVDKITARISESPYGLLNSYPMPAGYN